MRNGHHQKQRMRGRNRRNQNPLTRVYESNGPDVKIRGTAHHIAEKYVQLARDAQTSGDPVAAESYLQHAEHYFRLIAAAQAQFAQQNPHQQQQPYQRSDADDFDDEGDDVADTMQPQHPGAPGAPQPHYQPPQQPQPQQHQQYRPQPQHQPQPSFQPQQQQRRPEEQRDPGLPAFITGGGQAPNQGPGNGYDADQQGDRGRRFGRRGRFRPRGPGDFEPRNERQDTPVQSASNPATPEASPAEPTPPKPAGE